MKYRPRLELYFNLGFLSYETYIARDSFAQYAHDYVGLRWTFFKWNGGFRLYQLETVRRIQRETKKYDPLI